MRDIEVIEAQIHGYGELLKALQELANALEKESKEEVKKNECNQQTKGN